MRKVSETPNVDINSAYPDGGIRDRVGGTPGTPLRETLYHDWLQLGHKLMRDAGLVYNDLPDNETNGYQALQALQTEMDKRYRTAFQIATAAEWNAVGNNLNGILTPGDYLIIDTGGKANLPFAGFEGGLRVHARGTAYVQQEATDRFTQRTLVRTFSDGTWSGWSEGEGNRQEATYSIASELPTNPDYRAELTVGRKMKSAVILASVGISINNQTEATGTVEVELEKNGATILDLPPITTRNGLISATSSSAIVQNLEIGDVLKLKITKVQSAAFAFAQVPSLIIL